MKRRLLSLFLTLCVVSLVPGAALAADNGPPYWSEYEDDEISSEAITGTVGDEIDVLFYLDAEGKSPVKLGTAVSFSATEAAPDAVTVTANGKYWTISFQSVGTGTLQMYVSTGTTTERLEIAVTVKAAPGYVEVDGATEKTEFSRTSILRLENL